MTHVELRTRKYLPIGIIYIIKEEVKLTEIK